MEVVTLQSDAFKLIETSLNEIKTQLTAQKKKAPLSDTWLDNEDVCGLLKISKRTLQSYRDEQKIPFSQIGAKIFYKAGDVEEFLQSHYIKGRNRK